MIEISSKTPVLVLGGSFGGLWIAREFGKRGIDVYVVTGSKTNFAYQSKYCKKKIVLPEPWTCNILKKFFEKMEKASSTRLVVYSLTDLDTLNLSIIKDDFKDDFYFVVGKKEVTETLVNKRKFYEALDKTGIDYPRTFFPQDLENIKQIGKKILYPVFLRPSITQLFTSVFGPYKGFVAKSFRELVGYYRLSISNNVEVMLQEIIPGSPDHSFQLETYFNKEFYPIGFFARQRLRIWPPNFGNTTLCRSIPLSTLSLQSKEITDFLKSLKYNGLASAEFKKDERDNKFKLLEINARPWLHFWLSTKCGVDILYSSYLDAIGEKVKYQNGYASGIKSFVFYRDLFASFKMLRRHELALSEYFSSLKGTNQLTLLDKDDYLPFFHWVLENFVHTFNRNKKRNN